MVLFQRLKIVKNEEGKSYNPVLQSLLSFTPVLIIDHFLNTPCFLRGSICLFFLAQSPHDWGHSCCAQHRIWGITQMLCAVVKSMFFHLSNNSVDNTIFNLGISYLNAAAFRDAELESMVICSRFSVLKIFFVAYKV